MKEIRGDAKNVRSLLSASKYAIDYYQREYRWETKHIAELIEDLTGKFIESYDPAHERTEVERYGHYFLGSIIISDRDSRKFIIDGQQRLTSLTLLLIYLHRKLKDAEQQGQVAELIFSQKFGKRSFNLDVPERTACMEALSMFVSVYGAEAGNLALRGVATSGVYLGGGMAPKILPALQDGRFMDAFRAKGVMSELVARMPVKVMLNPESGLLGAAVAAQEMLS